MAKQIFTVQAVDMDGTRDWKVVGYSQRPEDVPRLTYYTVIEYDEAKRAERIDNFEFLADSSERIAEKLREVLAKKELSPAVTNLFEMMQKFGDELSVIMTKEIEELK